jgi:hypothetical protein
LPEALFSKFCALVLIAFVRTTLDISDEAYSLARAIARDQIAAWGKWLAI